MQTQQWRACTIVRVRRRGNGLDGEGNIRSAARRVKKKLGPAAMGGRECLEARFLSRCNFCCFAAIRLVFDLRAGATQMT